MYLTCTTALKDIYHQCSNKFGFYDVFANTTWFFIRDLVNCVHNNTPVNRSTYDEPVDFLDGNGFKVEGNDTDGYTISLLNN